MMASEQFILEMYDQLHPEDAEDVNGIEDMTGAAIDEINAIINDKHAVCLASQWIPDTASVSLQTLTNIMTAASLQCYTGLKKLDEKNIREFMGGDGKVDPELIRKHEDTITYYQDQIDAIELITKQLLEPLRLATHEQGFYMRGIDL